MYGSIDVCLYIYIYIYIYILVLCKSLRPETVCNCECIEVKIADGRKGLALHITC